MKQLDLIIREMDLADRSVIWVLDNLKPRKTKEIYKKKKNAKPKKTYQ